MIPCYVYKISLKELAVQWICPRFQGLIGSPDLIGAFTDQSKDRARQTWQRMKQSQPGHEESLPLVLKSYDGQIITLESSAYVVDHAEAIGYGWQVGVENDFDFNAAIAARFLVVQSSDINQFLRYYSKLRISDRRIELTFPNQDLAQVVWMQKERVIKPESLAELSIMLKYPGGALEIPGDYAAA